MFCAVKLVAYDSPSQNKSLICRLYGSAGVENKRRKIRQMTDNAPPKMQFTDKNRDRFFSPRSLPQLPQILIPRFRVDDLLQALESRPVLIQTSGPVFGGIRVVVNDFLPEGAAFLMDGKGIFPIGLPSPVGLDRWADDGGAA